MDNAIADRPKIAGLVCPLCKRPVARFCTIIDVRWECLWCRREFTDQQVVVLSPAAQTTSDDADAVDVVVSLVPDGVRLAIDDYVREQLISVVLDPNAARAVATDLVEMADTMDRLARENVG